MLRVHVEQNMLSTEQKRKIEENRARALARRNANVSFDKPTKLIGNTSGHGSSSHYNLHSANSAVSDKYNSIQSKHLDLKKKIEENRAQALARKRKNVTVDCPTTPSSESIIPSTSYPHQPHMSSDLTVSRGGNIIPPKSCGSFFTNRNNTLKKAEATVSRGSNSTTPMSCESFPAMRAGSFKEDDAKRRAEENRQKALQLRASKGATISLTTSSTPTKHSSSMQCMPINKANDNFLQSTSQCPDYIKRRADENRLKALALRAAKEKSDRILEPEHTSSKPDKSTLLPLGPNNVIPGKTSPRTPPYATQARDYMCEKQIKLPVYSYPSPGSSCSPSSHSAQSKPAPIFHNQLSKPKSVSLPQTNQTLPPARQTIAQVADSVTLPPNTRRKPEVEGKCILLSKHRFSIDIGYSAPLIQLFKNTSSKQYDSATKRWSFDLLDYNSLMQNIGKLDGAVKLEPLSRPVLNVFGNRIKGQRGSKLEPEPDWSLIDDELQDALFPFQKEGIKFAVEQKGRLLIADDMGLGKTLQALSILAIYRHDWPVLIVTPSSVRFTWREQILRWLPSVDPQMINVTLTGKDSCTSGTINLISYDMMVKRQQELVKKNFRIVVMDESHNLKNVKTARTQAGVQILKKARRVILLSGTPALSRPSELYTQISAVDPKAFPSFREFGLRYCEGREMPWGWDFTGSSNLTELQILLEEHIMIRRLKSHVLSQLPSKSREAIVLDPNSVKVNKVMKASHQLVDKMKGSDRRSALLEYFHETGAAKIPAVREYLLELLDSGRKLLVFAHHREMLDAIEEAVSKKKHQFIRIDGRTGPELRSYMVNRFQDDEEVKLALLSITAANAGINLTAASLVVFAELFWNPGILVQAEDRVHRIGQQDCVNVQYLLATGTADDYVWPLVQKKLDVLGKAGLGNKDDFAKTDISFRKFQDPKQKDLYAYFEDSFIEDDTSIPMEELMAPGNEIEIPPTLPSTSVTSGQRGQSSMFQYLKPCIPEPEVSHNPVEEAGDSDWLGDIIEPWDDEQDPSAPWPKKQRKF